MLLIPIPDYMSSCDYHYGLKRDSQPQETTGVPGASRSFTAEDDVVEEPRVSSYERVHQTGAVRCEERVRRL